MGITGRFDRIHNSLFQRARERIAPIVDHDIGQSSLSLYAREEIAFSRWVR